MIPIPKNTLAKSTLSVIEAIAANTVAAGSHIPPGYTSIESIGCKPNDPEIDNALIINEYYENTYGGIYLYAPKGQWFAYSCINSIDKTINLIGAGRTQTEWRSIGPAYFIMRERFNDEKGNFLVMDPVTIKGINFQCAGQPTGKITKLLDLAGLRIYHLCNIDDLNIIGFTGGGLQMYGQLDAGVHCNVSGSVIKNCMIANIKGDGVMIVGPDANACLFESLDIRDCTGIAVNDRSFLGNTFKAIMTHACERSFHVENVTAHSSFLGCYHEAGQKLPALGDLTNPKGYKELPYFEGMFTWDLGALNLKQ